MHDPKVQAERDDGQAMPIYMDYQATTPLDPRVLDAMLPFMTGRVGNPHSSTHQHGRQAMRAVEESREAVAALISASPAEVVFTSGATESNNMLLRGAVAAGARSGRSSVVTCATEHAAVLDVARWLERQGSEVSILGVDGDGLLDPRSVAAVANERTAIVSVMIANNEIGVVQPVAAIAEVSRSVGALFHSDASQAVGRVPIDVRSLGVDALSFTAHKLYGPMGIGAAFIAAGARKRFDALILGGGQQAGLRSGTLPVALCVGFGEAARICAAELAGEVKRISRLRNRFLATLATNGTGFELNGAAAPRLSAAPSARVLLAMHQHPSPRLPIQSPIAM